ncbi:MAG: NUDIX domain-containing protein, partial [Lactobacillaceae bacterium]|nr:NUDIX domain-containing protein [Lactobacillaceae bacterium]
LITNIFIENIDGKVVVQQRSFNKIGRPGEFDLVVSGAVLVNETSKQAAIREAEEELNLQITNPIFFKRLIEKNFIYDLYIAKTSFDYTDIKFQKSELENAWLVSLDNAKKILAKNKNNENYVDFIDKMDEELKNA